MTLPPASRDVSIVRSKEVRLLIGLVDAEADDPPGPYADDRAVIAGRRIGRAGNRLGDPPDLQAANPPRLPGGDVVDDEGDSVVMQDVSKLLAGRHVVAADVDGAEFLVIAEADRAGLRSPV